jgi:hypothetical protein
MNFPVWLYPDKDALVAMDKTPTLSESLRTHSRDLPPCTTLPGSPRESTRK